MAEYLGESPVDVLNHPVYSTFTPAMWGIHYITLYGGFEGDHHRAWVIDQVARILHGTPIKVTQARWSDGQKEDRFNTGKPSEAYQLWRADIEADMGEYDEGIAP